MVSELSSSSSPWLEPPPPPRRGARDDDNGKVDNVDVVGVDRQLPVGIRMAGGWVRDKLLNQHSADVDVALDCMMKVQFARIVHMASSLSSSWLSSTGEEDDDEGGATTCWFIAVDTLSTLGSLFLGSSQVTSPFYALFCVLGVGSDPRAALSLAWRWSTCYPQQSAGGRRPSCRSPA